MLGERPLRYGAVDVHYPAAGGATGALVITDDSRFANVVAELVSHLSTAEQYRPGSFFARELPAVRAVLEAAGPLELLIVDGYVDLDPHGRPGLGAHVHAEFDFPVVGVAKTAFRTATHAIAVLRNGATRPLYVTAAGIAIGDAAQLVEDMAGRYRLPDAMRRADALARGRVL